MTDRPDIPEDDEVLAAEFALRLLEGAEVEVAQRRALTDRAFADRVAFWNARLAELADEVADEAPSDTVRRALMDRLFADDPAPSQGTGGVAAWWRLLGLGATALAAALAVVLVAFPQTETVYVAELVSEDGTFRYLAVIDEEADTMRLVRTDGQPPSEGAMELWGHGPDEPPVSFGVISADARITVPVPDILKEDASQLTIAISNEPEGGSPTGQPTGDVLGIGISTDL